MDAEMRSVRASDCSPMNDPRVSFESSRDIGNACPLNRPGIFVDT